MSQNINKRYNLCTQSSENNSVTRFRKIPDNSGEKSFLEDLYSEPYGQKLCYCDLTWFEAILQQGVNGKGHEITKTESITTDLNDDCTIRWKIQET
jgi:hypothetical protein